ncbi:MAG TPA: hypothetical protein VML95_09495 [Longimicrobiales bacterium]|nr:hypothetical protein [Longimicrobiales bacterium]
MTLLAIDPGLDRAALAFFDRAAYEEGGAISGAVPGAFLGAGSIKTSTKDPDHFRLAQIHAETTRLCGTYLPGAAVIERPMTSRVYKGKAESVAWNLTRFYQARGVILAAVSPFCGLVIEARAG